MQGMGRWTMEEIKFSPTGVMTTTNPHSYYIPTSADVPRDMRITLLGDSPSPTAVHSSKAVGEPPFFLSSCVFFALKVRSLFFFFCIRSLCQRFGDGSVGAVGVVVESFPPPICVVTLIFNYHLHYHHLVHFLSLHHNLQEAIHASREEGGLKGHFRVDAPATTHRVRMACRDGKVLP